MAGDPEQPRVGAPVSIDQKEIRLRTKLSEGGE
jgi:hypothetical protein